MTFSDTYQRMDFSFEGQFLDFIRRDEKLKYIRLQVSSEELQVKLPKPMREAIARSLQPGDLIRVTGIGKLDHAAHTYKLKATQIVHLRDRLAQSELNNPLKPELSINPALAKKPEINSKTKLKNKPKVKVLVCQKSGCVKRGGRGLCEVLGQMLCDRGLDHQVEIERTGCLKKCSSAPNLMITPGNHHYTKVHSKVLPKIADEIAHYWASDNG